MFQHTSGQVNAIMPDILGGHQHAVPKLGGHKEVGQIQVLRVVVLVHPDLKEVALKLEAPLELTNVGLDIGKPVERAKGEGVGGGVGDCGPADKTRKYLV